MLMSAELALLVKSKGKVAIEQLRLGVFPGSA